MESSLEASSFLECLVAGLIVVVRCTPVLGKVCVCEYSLACVDWPCCDEACVGLSLYRLL